ncbi:MAG: hypothetical protein M3336_16455, partial [Chloroflexota bacterium]|nr:hypothetical protein [Chloroflexota bacterium]
RELLTEMQLGGGAFVSGTVLHGHFWLRACIVNPLARAEDIDALVTLVRELGAARSMSEAGFARARQGASNGSATCRPTGWPCSPR